MLKEKDPELTNKIINKQLLWSLEIVARFEPLSLTGRLFVFKKTPGKLVQSGKYREKLLP